GGGWGGRGGGGGGGGKGADRTRVARRGRAPGGGKEPMAGLDGEQAAKCGWADDRSVGLAAERERDHMGGHRRRRSRRRAAGRACLIVRIARGTRIEIGELGGHGLADDHRASSAQLRDHRSVMASPTPSGKR